MVRADAEKEFQDAVEEGREEGEKMCTDMISLACQVEDKVREAISSEMGILYIFFHSRMSLKELTVKTSVW